MAANDVTISVAAAGRGVVVHVLTRPAKDRVPVVGATTTIAANANSVFSLGAGETLIVERDDKSVNVLADMGLSVRKDHTK